MDGDILDVTQSVSGGDALGSVVVPADSGNSQNSGGTDVLGGSSVGNTNQTIVYNMEYDEDLGGYPVVIMNDLTAIEEVSTFALPSGSAGYQVSDYWINFFRGILQKNPFSDYLAFSTREYYDGSGYNNYLQHYWLYVGDLENGGEVTVYDCYSSSSIYYVDVTTERMGAVDVDSYSTLVYSNLGNASDFREGGGIYATLAILFFLGFFAVWTVCRDFFRTNLWRVYRRKG